ncbi:MAG: glycosyltransferase family 2 protein [Actinobacteria bacterium]|nr:glycosyltransferase family 2 protein [Actinomycetota bacterium]
MSGRTAGGTDVSVVIATYDRPDTLAVALDSVLRQTAGPREVVVVGDGCDDRTAEVVAGTGGPVRYLDLPFRCGEQAIPNAAGSAIARGEVIAYLNHDDVWLPDHLEHSLAAMHGSGAAWHLGAALFALRKEGSAVPRFTDRTPEGRSIGEAFHRTHRYLEPVSTWLVSRAALAGVGWWRPARRLYRTPTQDLALRLWRSAGAPSLSDRPTVLKAAGGGTRPAKGSGGAIPSYRQPSAWHADIAAAMRSGSLRAAFPPLDGARLDRGSHVAADPGGPPRWMRPVAERLIGRRAAGLYRRTGIDALAVLCRLSGVRRGALLGRMLQRRTGESALGEVDLDEVIRFAVRSGV